MSIPHSSDRPCRKVAGQTRGSLRTALAGSALAVAALFGTVALVQPAPVHAQAVRQLPDFTGLVEKTGGAVVNIRTTEHAGNPQGQGGEELLPARRHPQHAGQPAGSPASGASRPVR